MLGTLSEQLQNVFTTLKRPRKLTESNISDAVREVRLALLNADVNYGVTKQFVKRVKEKALGDKVLKAVSPGDQFVKVIHDELVALMGGEEFSFDYSKKPLVILLCGLQGAGKTTHCAKLAKFLKKEQKKPLLVACDLQRPAAVKQLQTLGEQIAVPVFSLEGETNPVKVAQKAMKEAHAQEYDVVILDTAGRLHVDEDLMEQLRQIRKVTQPHEVFFVANATTGQDAVTVAQEFDQKVGMTGSILTMLDGNTRGGAAISIREVTQKPLVFEGIGEKLDDLQLFNPHSMADRILGMGDTINLVKKAQEHMDEEEAKKLEQKIRKASFTYEDYIKQMGMVKKMGPLKGLLKMMPGMSGLDNLDMADEKFRQVEAIILSMTPAERREECELSMGRRKRIARGSGTKLDEVNRLVKTFKQMKQFFKQMPNMQKLEKMMGGAPWR